MQLDIIKKQQVDRIKSKAEKVFNKEINEYWYSTERLMKHDKRNLNSLEKWMNNEVGKDW
jgi:hypothetical protein